MSLRSLILDASVPVQKVMQKIHPPCAQTTVRMAEVAMQSMRDGDILLSREAWHFTNMFIPGFWSHAAIYGQGKVVESVAPAVQIVDFRDWVIEMHNWCVLRPMQADPTSGRDAFKFACAQDDKPYNYKFQKSDKSFWCSGLVYDAWEANSLWAQDVFVKRLTWGEWSVTPEDFYQAAFRGKLETIFEWRDLKEKNPKLVDFRVDEWVRRNSKG